MVRTAFHQKHWQDVEKEPAGGVQGGGGDRQGWTSKALSGKPALACWPLYQTTIYNLVSGRKCVPTFETIFWSTTPSFTGDCMC